MMCFGICQIMNDKITFKSLVILIVLGIQVNTMTHERRNAVVAGTTFTCLFVGAILLVLAVNWSTDTPIEHELAWWKSTLIYHIYVPSFKDTDGDGYGDLKGIKQELDYIYNLGIDSVWFSPFYKFGGTDMGNDVVDHLQVDELFGSNEDLEELFREMHEKNLRVIVDFIPNHTSDKHAWFLKSENREDPYTNYYVWKDPVDGSEPNNWKCATGRTAWKFSEKRGQYYLHNFLPDMPDLDLTNEDARTEMKEIFRVLAEYPSVMGFHIGAFNVLFEEFHSPEVVAADTNATITFLNELHEITKNVSVDDNLDRLFLLEMVENQHIVHWRKAFRQLTLGVAVVPFSFGNLPWDYGYRNMSGDVMYESIMDYLVEAPEEEGWPCWEMNDHDSVHNTFGRVPFNLNDLIFMTSLLLPGTAVIYYGDEIGMANHSSISFEETMDPYAKEPYCTADNYTTRSRDPVRTPMQWTPDTNANFTTADKPWLPIADDYKEHNVQTEYNKTDTHLKLFTHISNLRRSTAFYDGEVFFPFHDKDIFSFLRKSADDSHGYLVVLYVSGGRAEVDEKVDHRVIDFTSIMPGFPSVGTISATSHGEDHQLESQIDMSEVILHPYDGLVILLNFGSEELET